MKHNPLSGDLYVFFNRAVDKVRILHWETNGFVLYCKYLEEDTFVLPNAKTDEIIINGEQLNWLLDGIDINFIKRHKKLTEEHKDQQELINLLQERNKALSKMISGALSEKIKKVVPDEGNGAAANDNGDNGNANEQGNSGGATGSDPKNQNRKKYGAANHLPKAYPELSIVSGGQGLSRC